MHDLATRLKIEALTKQTGRTASVLWEQQVNAEGGLWSGYTPEYHKVLSNNSNITESCITEVSIDQVSEDGLTLLNQSTQHEIAVSF
jgi:tRNA A37 methylthiotransferase MiaB